MASKKLPSGPEIAPFTYGYGLHLHLPLSPFSIFCFPGSFETRRDESPWARPPIPPSIPSFLPSFLPSRLTRKFLLFLPFLSLPPPPPVNRSNRAEPSGRSRARFYTELCCATPFSALRRYKTQLGCCSGLSDIFNNLINVLRTLPAERPVARARQCPAQSAPLPCPVTLFCLARPRSSLSPPPPPSA